jgi:hypothetical protein
MYQVTQFRPVSPSPATLVIVPSWVLMSRMVGFSVGSIDIVETLVKLSGMMCGVVVNVSDRAGMQ